jgi:hypothetical protein
MQFWYSLATERLLRDFLTLQKTSLIWNSCAQSVVLSMDRWLLWQRLRWINLCLWWKADDCLFTSTLSKDAWIFSSTVYLRLSWPMFSSNFGIIEVTSRKFSSQLNNDHEYLLFPASLPYAILMSRRFAQLKGGGKIQQIKWVIDYTIVVQFVKVNNFHWKSFSASSQMALCFSFPWFHSKILPFSITDPYLNKIW